MRVCVSVWLCVCVPGCLCVCLVFVRLFCVCIHVDPLPFWTKDGLRKGLAVRGYQSTTVIWFAVKYSVICMVCFCWLRILMWNTWSAFVQTVFAAHARHIARQCDVCGTLLVRCKRLWLHCISSDYGVFRSLRYSKILAVPKLLAMAEEQFAIVPVEKKNALPKPIPMPPFKPNAKYTPKTSVQCFWVDANGACTRCRQGYFSLWQHMLKDHTQFQIPTELRGTYFKEQVDRERNENRRATKAKPKARAASSKQAETDGAKTDNAVEAIVECSQDSSEIPGPDVEKPLRKNSAGNLCRVHNTSKEESNWRCKEETRTAQAERCTTWSNADILFKRICGKEKSEEALPQCLVWPGRYRQRHARGVSKVLASTAWAHRYQFICERQRLMPARDWRLVMYVKLGKGCYVMVTPTPCS